MSETEHVKGTITKIESELPIEELCKKVLDENGIDKEDFYDNYQEALIDEYEGGYLVMGDDLYSIIREDVDPYGGIYNASKNDNGYAFEVRFHNGGCCLEEAIIEAVGNCG